MSVEDTIEQRTKFYHKYSRNVMVRRIIVNAILDNYKETHGHTMPEQYQEFVWDIANKVGRISMEPTLLDTWHDIQGYAKLVEDHLKETGEAYEIRAQSEDEVERGSQDRVQESVQDLESGSDGRPDYVEPRFVHTGIRRGDMGGSPEVGLLRDRANGMRGGHVQREVCPHCPGDGKCNCENNGY